MELYSERTVRWFHNSYTIDESTGCWLWHGRVHHGKATMQVGLKELSARRVAYALAFGAEPDARTKLDVKCGQRLCVNAEHFLAKPKSLMVNDKEKYCSSCGRIKSLEAFPPCSTGAGGAFNYCRPCFSAYKRRAYQRDSQVKEHSRLRGYGLTQASYASMLEEQGGVCAICGGTNGERPLAVDHDGATGRVRSLLCNSCNSGIALLRHDLDVARAAVRYLEHWSGLGAVVGPDIQRALAVLGPERVVEIKERLARGEPVYRLAKEYAVSKRAISDLNVQLWYDRRSTRCGGLGSIFANQDDQATSSSARPEIA